MACKQMEKKEKHGLCWSSWEQSSGCAVRPALFALRHSDAPRSLPQHSQTLTIVMTWTNAADLPLSHGRDLRQLLQERQRTELLNGASGDKNVVMRSPPMVTPPSSAFAEHLSPGEQFERQLAGKPAADGFLARLQAAEALSPTLKRFELLPDSRAPPNWPQGSRDIRYKDSALVPRNLNEPRVWHRVTGEARVGLW